jgi:hypothetical protein
MWADGVGESSYRAYVMAEYHWASEAVLTQWCERRVAGAYDADLYEDDPLVVSEALGAHVARLAQVRALLVEAERLLQSNTVPARRRPAVSV